MRQFAKSAPCKITVNVQIPCLLFCSNSVGFDDDDNNDDDFSQNMFLGNSSSSYEADSTNLTALNPDNAKYFCLKCKRGRQYKAGDWVVIRPRFKLCQKRAKSPETPEILHRGQK